MAFENPLGFDRTDDFGDTGMVDLTFEEKYNFHSSARSADRRAVKDKLQASLGGLANNQFLDYREESTILRKKSTLDNALVYSTEIEN